MHRAILVLLASLALLVHAADKPAEKPVADKPTVHTENFVGRGATLPLVTGGKAVGNIDLAFGAEAITSKWLAARGFPKVPYEVDGIAQTKNGTHWRVTVNTTNAKGDQLMMSASLKGEELGITGNVSVIAKSGKVETFTYKGKTAAGDDKKK